jgi:hypothetical protein
VAALDHAILALGATTVIALTTERRRGRYDGGGEFDRLRKFIAATLSVVATLFFALTAAGSLSERSFGLTTVPASSACELVVTGVTAAGSATGLRSGDTIDARRLSAHERLRLMVPRTTDAMMLPARRASAGGGMEMLMAVPSAEAPGDAAFVRLGILLLLMLLGLYVLWRGRDTASLGLGTFFALIPAFFLSHAYASLPDAAIIAVLFLAAMLNVFGYFGLFVMVDALAGHTLAPAGRRTAQTGAYGALTVAAIILFSSTYGRVFTGCPPLANVQIVVACYAIVIVLCFVLLWRGLVDPERSAERGRLRWVFWATVVGFSGPLVSFACISAGRPVPLAGVVNLSFLAVPLGYTYAVLRHRVIDVGFVLNRALSLTILTTGLVVFFIVVESLLEHLAVGHAESTLVQIGFSLGLGMLFNRAHAWLEHRLERVLFRRRYALEESLRTLGERAESFDDEDALMTHVVVALHAALGLAGCAIYRESAGRAVLAASAGSGEFPEELHGDGSLPIGIGRKRYGDIVWREDPAKEAFASEEIALLRSLSQQLAAAIAVLRAAKYEQLVKGTP